MTDAFEPASIFKVITAGAGLQEKVVRPDEVIDCGGGSIEIAGTRINDHRVFDSLRFRDVIAKSSDVGVIRVAQRLGRDNFYRYIRDFGFGVPTGVELPGESSGILRPTARWSALSLPSLSFGQEIGVTALQVASALGAVANGGYLMKPLVRQVEDPDGRVVKSFRPLAVRRVLEPETVEVLTDILRGVVREAARGDTRPFPATRWQARPGRPRRSRRGIWQQRWSPWYGWYGASCTSGSDHLFVCQTYDGTPINRMGTNTATPPYTDAIPSTAEFIDYGFWAGTTEEL